MKKSKYVKEWFLAIKRFFRLLEYSENMKVKIFRLILKGKEDIWWEDVKHVRGNR